jgi:oxaloacetate decarboxylase (Na+ extruding) subunit alpha
VTPLNATRFVDATLRDLAAPPWGATLDTEELVAAAAALAGSGALALEALDPPSARATVESRNESPWDRLRAVVRVAGSTPVGIVIAARTLWGDRPVAPGVVRQLVLCACDSGARRIRALDPLNAVETLRPAADAAAETGAAFVPTLTLGPTPDATDPLWISEARALAGLPGVSSICIADGGGFLAPQELATLVAAVIEATGCSVELALQAPAGIAPLSAVAGVDAGVTAIHASAGLVALAASRPAISTMHAALAAGHVPLSAEMDRVDVAARLVGAMLPADRMRHAAAALSAPALSLPPELVAGLISRLVRLGVLDRIRQTGDEVVAIARDLGAVTLAGPIGAAIVAQAARHAMDGDRWGDMDPILAAVAMGHYGPLRGPVAAEALAAAETVRPAGLGEIGVEEMHRDGPSGASEEDLVLWAQFPDAAERLHRRRRSLTDDMDEPHGTPGLDRLLLETLVDVVEGSDEAEVQVEVGGARVTVRRAGLAVPVGGAAASPNGPAGMAEGMVRVESPMVGTFYRSSSPEAGVFCNVGDRVEPGQTLCLVEAMKLFNEISSAVAGVVKEILVENEEPVEYGQTLFVIEPA